MRNLNLLFVSLFLLVVLNTAKAQDWNTVKSFSGEGITNTEAFNINQNEWRVVYESEAVGYSKESDGAGHIFQVYLEKPNDEASMDILANQTNKTFIEGKSSVYDQGRFYLKVNAANGEWNIKVQVPSETNFSYNTSRVTTSVERGKIDATNYNTMVESLKNVDATATVERREQFQKSLLKIMASELTMAKMMEISQAEQNGESADDLLVDVVRDKIHGKTISEVITLANNINLDETEQKLYQIMQNSEDF